MPRTERNGAAAGSVKWARVASITLAVSTLAVMAHAQKAPAAASTTSPVADRIKASGTIKFGYRTDARPFAYKDASGNAAGFSVDLCLKVADGLKTELGLAALKVEWVPLALDERLAAVQQGKVDLLCGAETITLTKRETLAFSLPIFPSGIGALLRTDAPARLQQILSGQPQTSPVWRASAGQLLSAQTFAVVNGTTAMPWLASKLVTFELTAKVQTVNDYAAGIRQVVDRQSNVLFGDRAILLDGAVRDPSMKDLMVLDRFFTYEPLALAMSPGDSRFRLAVDRSLSRHYAAPDFRTLYMKWFGAPDATVLTFYRWNALSE